MQEIVYCRTASSLGGGFEGTPEQVWGTPEYEGDINSPTVFFGLYGLKDFYALWRHKGKKYILWAGSDIRHFVNGYWLDDVGEIRLNSQSLARWININCESYVENEVERKKLAEYGIESKVIPSFLGDVNKFEVSYRHNPSPKVYASVSGNDFELYGWDKIEEVAGVYSDIQFHLYGNTVEWATKNLNVIVHGRVPKEQFNEDIKKMQGGIRLVPFDGASEVIVKSVLMGQYPLSMIRYPFVSHFDEIEKWVDLLKSRKDANLDGREWWIKNLNQYPWDIHKKLGEK